MIIVVVIVIVIVIKIVIVFRTSVQISIWGFDYSFTSYTFEQNGTLMATPLTDTHLLYLSESIVGEIVAKSPYV